MAWPGWENFTGLVSPPKRSKYNAQPTQLDGIRFDSRKEAARYSVLTMMEKAGEIHALTLQPKFPLLVGDVRIGEYRGDFQYSAKGSTRPIVEDVKGMDTPLSKWKRKHVRAQYGIEVRIV